MKNTITVRFPDGWKKKIMANAVKRGLKLSDVLREAVRVFFKL